MTAVENKASLKNLTSLKEQIDENTNNKLKDLLNITKRSIADLERKTREEVDELGNKVRDLDKNLAWKMSELETLFKSRASTKYVDDSVKDLEERLRRMVGYSSNKDGLECVGHGERYWQAETRPGECHEEPYRHHDCQNSELRRHHQAS
jgi:hypothetical protein